MVDGGAISTLRLVHPSITAEDARQWLQKADGDINRACEFIFLSGSATPSPPPPSSSLVASPLLASRPTVSPSIYMTISDDDDNDVDGDHDHDVRSDGKTKEQNICVISEGPEPQKEEKQVFRFAPSVRWPMPDLRPLPVDLRHAFLPPDLAVALFRYLNEASRSWSRTQFRIGGRDVASKHEAFSYMVDKDCPLSAAEDGGGYNASSREAPPILLEAISLVETHVNALRARRPLHPLEEAGPWKVGLVVINKYDHGDASLGYHSDKLTPIGPLPTIASLTLGAKRLFGIKPVPTHPLLLQKKLDKEIFVPLAHNDLLVMGPTFMEMYQHGVPKVKAVLPGPIDETRMRINLTFRMMRPVWFDHPLRPVCPHCSQKAHLRNVSKQIQHRGKYFWMCIYNTTANGHVDAAQAPTSGTPHCGFMQWAKDLTQPRQDGHRDKEEEDMQINFDDFIAPFSK